MSDTATIPEPSAHAQTILDDVAGFELRARYERLKELLLAKEAAATAFFAHQPYTGAADDVDARLRHTLELKILDRKWCEAICAFNRAAEESCLNVAERSQ